VSIYLKACVLESLRIDKGSRVKIEGVRGSICSNAELADEYASMIFSDLNI